MTGFLKDAPRKSPRKLRRSRPRPGVRTHQFCNGRYRGIFWDGEWIYSNELRDDTHDPKDGFCGCSKCTKWRWQTMFVMRSEVPLTDWEAAFLNALFGYYRPLTRWHVDHLNRIYNRARAFVKLKKQAMAPV